MISFSAQSPRKNITFVSLQSHYTLIKVLSVSSMASSKLTWVYGRTHRAKDLSNEAIDKYKSIIRQLYLGQNMTRDEVLSHLQEVHGFVISYVTSMDTTSYNTFMLADYRVFQAQTS
jgi:hypothetical protein